ncbi:MAG: aminoglycoside phosphotransferase family protein [Luteolibacter sp.]
MSASLRAMSFPGLEQATAAAKSIAAEHGLAMDRCEILQNGSTLVLRLSDTLVARVVQDQDGARQGTAWFERENAVALHLAEQGAPVIPLHPDLPPGPYFKNEFPVNFWKFVHITDQKADPYEIGKTLYQCHVVLRGYEGELPELAIIRESLDLLETVKQRELMPVEQIEMLRERMETSLRILADLPFQPLHGDAHEGNLLQTTEGLLWTDWEDTFSGPVEWDLASILWNARILEKNHAKADAVLQGYRDAGGTWDETVLQHCYVARAAVMCSWYLLLYPNPSPERQEILRWRMEWLANA